HNYHAIFSVLLHHVHSQFSSFLGPLPMTPCSFTLTVFSSQLIDKRNVRLLLNA
uniref:Intraflagellar transport protein 122 homolog n=1 Tax=Parascaris univalens TaxID=6257 RepID=A0A915B634_PARUN